MKGDFAFVEHMLAVMKPDTGRLAVVMPQGVLFRTGVERDIRRRIVDNGRVEAVIGLPPNLFYNTGLPACVLVCRARPRADREGHVLFVDASRRFVKQGARNTVTPTDIAAIVEAFRTGHDPDGPDGISVSLVPVAAIVENNWDMSIGRYIAGASADTVDLETAASEYVASKEALLLAQEQLDARLAEVGVLV